MAEVVDIVTRLSYQTETGELKKALATIQEQSKTIGILEKQIAKLEQMQERAASSEVSSQKRISDNLQKVKAERDKALQSLKDQIQSNKEVQRELEKERQLIGRLERQVNTLQSALDKAMDKRKKGVDDSIKAIEREIKSIDAQYASIERLQVLRAKTDKNNVDQLKKIDAAISNRFKVIAQETKLIENNIKSNESLRKALVAQSAELLNSTDRLDKFAGSSGKANYAMLNLARVVQDAPYGFIGIANNIDPLLLSLQSLQKESGGTRAALKSLGGALMGGAGIGLAVSVVTSLLVTFGSKLFSTGKEAGNAAGKISAFDQALQSAAKNIADEIIEIQKLRDVIENTNVGYQERGKAVDELQSKYPEYFMNLDREKILNGEVKDSYDLVTDSIIERAKKTAEYNILLAKQTELQQAQLELDQITNNKNAGTFFYTDQARIDQLRSIISERTREIDQIQTGMRVRQSAGVSNAYWLDQEAKKQYEANQAKEKALALMTKEQRAEYEKNLRRKPQKEHERRIFASMGLPDDAEMDAVVTQVKDIDLLQKAVEEIFKRGQQALAESLTGGGFADNPSRLNAQLELQRDIRGKQEKDDKEADDKRKKAIKSIVQSYQTAAELIIQSIQSIHQAQINLLDAEIQIRRDRVSQAVELAERGNAEILKSEQERLNEAQKKREEIARKQLQLNALLQASSAALSATQAIQTVTNAGASGDPYSTPARIAAAVAALAAGFAFVTSLMNAFKTDAFAEGVVDYKGNGTTKSDSNMVRISKGESVITAEATQKYKPILEAMNKGIPLPYTMVMPSQKGNDISALKKEFSLLREAFEMSGIKVQTNVSNGQIYTIVERQRQIEQRRWS